MLTIGLVLLSQGGIIHARVAVFNHFADLVSHVWDMGPQTCQQFAEHQDALVSHFEGANSWNHRVRWAGRVIARNQLAVSVLHRPSLGNLVEEHAHLRASRLRDLGGN